MPVGIYEQTEKHCERKGRVFTEEHRKKLSLASSMPRPWKIGVRFTKEHKEKISKAHRGKILSDVTKLRISKANSGKPSVLKGRKQSKEVIEKKRLLAVGKPWSKARREAQEARKGKPYESRIGKIRKSYKSFSGKEYSFDWHIIRKKVYKRDNWTCQECGAKCHNSTKRKIQCHHIDYDEANNDFSNLITLCASCHCKTNFKRKDWESYYKNKMGV